MFLSVCLERASLLQTGKTGLHRVFKKLRCLIILSIESCCFFLFYYSLGQPKVSLSFGPSCVEKEKNITLPECHVTRFPSAVTTWSKVHGKIEQGGAVLKGGQLSLLN